MRRLISYLTPFRVPLSFTVILLLVAKGIEAYVPFYLGKIVEQILGVDGMLEPALVSACSFVLVLLFFGYFLDAVSVTIKSWVSQEGLFRLRTDVYDHIQRLPTAYFDRNAVGQLMTRTIHDIDQINVMFSESVVPLISSCMLFVGITIAVICVDWRVALAISCVLPFAVWLTHHFRISQRRCFIRIRAIVGRMNGFVQEHLMGVSTIRSFGLERAEESRFSEINEDHCSAYLETIRHFAFFFAGIDFLQSMALVMVFMVLGLSVDGFSPGLFFTFSLYTLMVFRPLYDLADRYNVLQSAMAAAERVFRVLDVAQEVDEGAVLKKIETIEFRDVWFAYEGDEWVLQGISFAMKRGDSLALVGMTGAGKTSILNLLLRLYDFQKGEILINGEDIRSYSLSSLRGQFSAVLQDPVIFSGTILENVTLGDETILPEDVESAIDYVNLRDLLRRFPEGLQHELKEQGKGLSVGEMQLISLARAVAHHASVVVLDEATANIDSATERLIQSALTKLFADRTALVIAHRLSTIQHVNRIVVIHDGCVIESGTHESLLATKGMYEKLYRLQFQTS